MFIFDGPDKMYGDYATKPNLNLYKDAEHKFSATNVVYGFFNSAAHEAELYTDPDCTIPLTLSKAVELIQNGVQIVGCLNWPGTLAFGLNTAGQKVIPNPFAEN